MNVKRNKNTTAGEQNMRSFENIAKLIREKRVSHPKGYSQSELSQLLGYKNGQFISNVERALCNVPLKMLGRVSEILNISHDDLKEAILEDQRQTLENFLKAGDSLTSSPTGGRASDSMNASL